MLQLINSRRFLIEWLFCCFLLLGVGSYIAYAKFLDHQRIESRERAQLSSQALVIEKNLSSQLVATSRALDRLILDLSDDHANRYSAHQLNERLKLIANTLTGISPVLVTNATGQITHASVGSLIDFDASGRAYFQDALQRRSKDTLYVSAPFTSALGTTNISLVREVPAAGGEFGGLVLAAFEPTFSSVLLESVRFTADTHVALLHGDGQLFMNVPDGADRSDFNQAGFNRLLIEHRLSGRAANTFILASDFAVGERVVAIQTVQPQKLGMDKALVVTVSREMSSIFADWHRENILLGWIYAGLTIVVLSALHLYQRRQRAFQHLALQREKVQRASDKRLLSFFEAMPDAMLISDTRGVITMANQQITTLLGYSVQELLGKTIDELVPHRSRANHPKCREEFFAAPNARQMACGTETTAVHKDGSERHVEVSLSRIETDEGLSFASALRDISGQIHAKEQLLASETHLRTIIDNEPDCISLVDAHGILINMNPAGLMMMEADTLVQIVGHAAIECVDPEFRNQFADLHERVMAGESVQLTFKAIGLKGGRRWLETRVVPMLDRGQPVQLAVTRDITERKAADERIRHLAYYDQLTGLPNRTLLLDRLKQMIGANSRSGLIGSMLFIDLDHFKTLNDTLGHDVGDMQLKEVARRLANCIRESDTVARVGGDEFAVILAGLSKTSVEAASDTEGVAAKILAALNKPFQLGEVSHSSSASIGITLFQGDRANIDNLMKQADLAMYRAKDSGRNAMCFFDQSMETAVVRRVAMEKDLRSALEKEQFLLHYQAQVDEFGHVTGAEVLVRWCHPELGMVSPADFIPLAEETGVILELGNWVMKTACIQLTKWRDTPTLAHLTLAVNVSACQFAQADFVDQVMAIIQLTGVHPGRLKLELTESLLVGSMDDIIEKMVTLKNNGIGFSLDDFGTGYSSLAYLSRLPLDQLKIDKSFVNNVLGNPVDAAIARTIIALAHSLNLGVIAEGVETHEQRVFLANAGCQACQGYLFSRPIKIEDFEAFALNRINSACLSA